MGGGEELNPKRGNLGADGIELFVPPLRFGDSLASAASAVPSEPRALTAPFRQIDSRCVGTAAAESRRCADTSGAAPLRAQWPSWLGSAS